jgi:yersiniabactin nonribosomal peptide synthetase
MPKGALHEPVLAQAGRQSDAAAVLTTAAALSYGDLVRRARHLSDRLRAAGARPGSLVAIVMEKGWEQPVAALAVMCAGAAYVPIDSAAPRDRIAWLLEHTRAPVVITQPWLDATLAWGPGIPRLVVGRDDEGNTRPEGQSVLPNEHDHTLLETDLAYVIFTSGSTGRPKGVMIEHRAAHNTVADINHRLALGPDDRIFGISALSFDLSVWDLFGTFAAGAALVLPDAARSRDPAHWASLLRTHRVTVWNSVPAVLEMLVAHLEAERVTLPDLRHVLLSGDWIPITLPARVRAVAPNASIMSLGGATEASIWSIAHPANDVPAGWTSVPYGTPLTNQTFHVLNDVLAPCPDYVPGELYIGGVGLARGYFLDEEKTIASFIVHPVTGERLYRTGDLGRYHADGTIEFLGRRDTQVKIHGYRVELGEIESVLREHTAVRDVCAVFSRPASAAAGGDTGRALLAAYVVPHAGHVVERSELRAFLGTRLPEYMVPASIVVLDAMPLSSNGKVDRAALPDPTAVAHAADHVGPRDDTERRLVALWSEVLHVPVERIGARDNFFTLGGHSILLVTLAQRLVAELGVEVPLVRLFQEPTLEAQARLLLGPNSRLVSSREAIEAVPESRFEPFPLREIQEAYWLGRQLSTELGGAACYVYREYESTKLDPFRLAHAWNSVVGRHDMLRTIVTADGRQQTLRTAPRAASVIDLRRLDPSGVEAALAAMRARLSHQVLPTEHPLWDVRIALLSTGAVRVAFGIDMLVADAMSLTLLWRDWGRSYTEDRGSEHTLALTFRDCVVAEETRRGAPQYARARAYWQARLGSLVPAPALPRPAVASPPNRAPEFTRRERTIEYAAWAALRTRAAQNSLTPAGVLIAAYAEILATWSTSPRFTLNVPTFNRPRVHPQVDEIVGHFSTTVLLDVDLQAPTFSERAAAVQAQLWRDLEHREYGGVAVLRDLARLHGRPGAALMPVVLTVGDLDGNAAEPPDAWLGQRVHAISQTPQVRLDCQVYEERGALVLAWDAVEAAFPSGVLDAMFDALAALLSALASDDDAPWREPLGRIGARRTERKERVGGAPAAECVPIHLPVISAATRRPHAPAVLTPARTVAFGELTTRAGALAVPLTAAGARPGTLVAVVMEKGWEQPIAAIAALSVGAAYVPLDPSLPRKHLAWLLEHTRTPVVVTQPWFDRQLAWPPEIRRLVVGRDDAGDGPALANGAQVSVEPDALAYVVYTSGPAGRPQGVMMEHRAAYNTLAAVNRRLALGPEDRVLGISPFSFDLSVWDVFGALATCAALVLPDPERMRDPAHWHELIDRFAVTVWNSVPSVLEMLVEHLETEQATLPRLRHVLVSSGRVPLGLPARVRALAPNAIVTCLGGATEAGIWSAAHVPDVL